VRVQGSGFRVQEKNMGEQQRPVAVITGASSGIGLDLAKLFAQGGHDLVLVARNEEALRGVAAECERFGVKAHVLAKDLSDPGAAQEILDELAARGIVVEVLVNNAGFGTHGAFAETKLEEEVGMIQVNIVALIQLTRLFLPGMIARRSGKIMNVASVAGFVPGPYMSVYYATKAFVLSHSVALAQEVKGSGVIVSALCPGPTKTEFQKRAKIAESKLFKKPRSMTSMEVAKAGYEGLMKGKMIVVPGFSNKVIRVASKVMPRGVVARVAGKMNRDR
jgi:short-subunit dehydrogenase